MSDAQTEILQLKAKEIDLIKQQKKEADELARLDKLAEDAISSAQQKIELFKS